MNKRIIVCDKCKAEFELSKSDFKEKTIKLSGIKFGLVYFQCPECKETYLVTMLDNKAKQLQDRYIKAIDSYNLALKKGSTKAILTSKQQRIDELKAQALSYEQELLNKYRHTIPDSVLEE